MHGKEYRVTLECLSVITLSSNARHCALLPLVKSSSVNHSPVDCCCSFIIQNGAVLHEGEWVSLNGVTGEVIKGQQPVKKPAMTGDLGTFMKWVDAKRRMRVLTNADTPEDAKVGFLPHSWNCPRVLQFWLGIAGLRVEISSLLCFDA